jgi:DNA-binding NarL/FixJ family response regulator
MRVIIADDAPMIRSAYRAALTQSGIIVAAETKTSSELIKQARIHGPDAALIDISFQRIDDRTHDIDGLEAAAQLRKEHPALGMLIYSVFMSPSYLACILKISEHHIGYLGKDRVADFNVVVDALHQVAGGGTVIDQELWAELLNHRKARTQLGNLSARKRQTLDLLTLGLSNKAIADRMQITERTVEGYIRETFSTLTIPETPDLNKRVCAVLAWLRETGALPLP